MTLIIDPETNKVITQHNEPVHREVKPIHTEPEVKLVEPIKPVDSISHIETKVTEVKKESHLPSIHTNPISPPIQSKVVEREENKYNEEQVQNRIEKAIKDHKKQNPNIDRNKVLASIRNILWGTGMDSQQFEKSMIEITKLFS